ncbi:TPA: DUF1317 family protein [Escherichia coli]|nr:DUF1317 family protein [Escherichia coli]EFO1042953.1 DUF1317 family protein [Escherichia coli]HAK9997864.1 DUF1317 family protein [Escherichia coli]
MWHSIRIFTGIARPIGAITFVYSVTKRGWVFPGLSVIRNPLKAQRLAEEINNKRGAVCTKHLLLS